MAKIQKNKISEVDLSLIDEPKAVVRMGISPEAVSELAQSISEIGLLQPILLRKDGERYEVIAGHRRFLAHRELGATKISAIIKIMTDQEAAVARATENLSREDLTPIEEAATYKDLVDSHAMSLDQISAKVGKSPGLVKRRMDLLKMPESLQKALHSKVLSIGVAEELWGITDAAMLSYYLGFALEGGCTVAVARQWRHDWLDSQRRSSSEVGDGGGLVSPYEPRPTFIPCDLCDGPVELGQDRIFRACPDCSKLIINAIKGV